MTVPALPHSFPALQKQLPFAGTAMPNNQGVKGRAASSPGFDAATGTPIDAAAHFPALLGDLIGGTPHPDARPQAKPSKKTAENEALPAGPVTVAVAKDTETVLLFPFPFSGDPAPEPAQPADPAGTQESTALADAPPVTPGEGTVSSGTGLPVPAGEPPVAPSTATPPDSKQAVSQTPVAGETLPPESKAEPVVNSANPIETDPGPGPVPADTPADTPADAAGDPPTDWARLLNSAEAQPPAAAPATAPKQTAPRQPNTSRSTASPTSPLPVANPTPVVSLSAAVVSAQPAPLPAPERRPNDQPPVSLRPSTQVPVEPVRSESDVTPKRVPVAGASVAEPEATNLAFAAHLTPLTAPVEPAAASAALRPTQTEVPITPAVKPVVPAPAQPDGAPAEQQRNSNSQTGDQEPKNAPPERVRKPETPQAASAEPPVTAGKIGAQMPVAPEPAARILSGQPSGPADPNPPQTKDAGSALATPDPPRVPASATDIRLEVKAGDQRVEVRLVERGGEVHVAVRTPDAQLAENLREDLPALSSRLTESGFRTETWRPGASGSPEFHRLADMASAGSPQDASGQPRQNGQERHPEDRQPARPKVPEEQMDRKQKGKDFEWLMSTLR